MFKAGQGRVRRTRGKQSGHAAVVFFPRNTPFSSPPRDPPTESSARARRTATSDHYRTLGLRPDATKAAFRRRSLRDHPDRHAHSDDVLARADAARRFRQASEYDLSDDLRRAEYDLRLRSSCYARASSSAWASSSSSASYGYGYGYGYGPVSWCWPPPGGGAASAGFDWGFLLKAVTRRGFLINLGFSSVLLAGAAFLDGSILELWKTNNSGNPTSPTQVWINRKRLPPTLPKKSFEDAMVSIEEVKMEKGE